MTNQYRRARFAGAATTAIVLAASLSAVAGTISASALDLPSGGISLWHDLSLTSPTARITRLTHDVGGNIWYFDDKAEDLVRVDQNTHAQTAFDLGSRLNVLGVVGAADGSVWYTDSFEATINRLDPMTGLIQAFPLTGVSFTPGYLALGSDGKIWFGDPYWANLVSVDATGAITVIPEPTGERVADVVGAPDGRIWYTRTGVNRVGAYDPSDGTFADMGGGPSTGSAITVGKSGDVWVGGLYGFVEIAMDGTVTDRHVTGTGPIPVMPVDMIGGDIAGDDSAEIHFLDQEYGYGTVDDTGVVHFSRLDGSRTALDIDGQGHLWANELWSDSLTWY